MKDKVRNYILSRRWTFTIAIIVIGFTLVGIITFFANRDILFKDSALENLYYASQIVSALFVSVGVLIAGWQYVIATRAEIMSVNISQIQKAIDLSAFYKDNILKPFIAIHYVFERSGILEIMDTIRAEDMKNFDFFEMNQILPMAQQEKLKELLNILVR